jgi:hypothetical protein
MTDTPIGTTYLVPGRQALLWPEGPLVVPASACGSAAAKDDRNHHQTTGSERKNNKLTSACVLAAAGEEVAHLVYLRNKRTKDLTMSSTEWPSTLHTDHCVFIYNIYMYASPYLWPAAG